MPGSSLELSPSTEQRIVAAAAVLRVSPETFLRRLLSQHYNTLGGLPLDLLRYILAFLDYSTISSLVARVSKFWQECVLEAPQNFFSRLRQMHGIHLLDPVHGMFYFPRALKRVVFDTKSGGGGGGAATATMGQRSGGDLRRALSPASIALHSNAQAVPASSFLTVDIRTQNTKSLPWGHVQVTVRRAIERERMEFGTVCTLGLQRPEDPVWSQAATITYDRRIYMFGGETYEGVVLDCVYEYDPMTKHWTVLPDMSEKRAAASAVAFRGRIFVFGGYNEEGVVLDTYEVLDVATQSWVSQQYPPSWLYSPSQHRPAHEIPSTPTKADGVNPTAAHVDPNHAAFLQSIPSMNDVAGAAASAYRMPEKICGTAATVHGDVILFAGGHQSCIAPDQTAVSYSAMNSTSTTPMHSVGGPLGGGVGSRSVAGTPSPGYYSNAGTNNNANNSNNNAGGGGGGTVGSDPASAMAGTPVIGGFDNVTTPTTAGLNNTNTSTRTNSPPRLPRVNSIAFDGPATAETLVWVFSPITGQWWQGGPRLPSPRAFGALTVLELPVLGHCLCYFGGCAKADAPETAMFYIPLCDPQSTRLASAHTSDDAAPQHPSWSGDSGTQQTSAAGKGTANKKCEGGNECCTTPPSHASCFLHSVQDPWPASLRDATPQLPQQAEADVREGVAPAAMAAEDSPSAPPSTPTAMGNRTNVARAASTRTATAATRQHSHLHPAPRTPTGTAINTTSSTTSAELDGTRLSATQPPASEEQVPASTVNMVVRCFRDAEELPWQRYVRVPIGGAFTSVAVLGGPHSRTVVLTGFYPAPNIGFCKVNHLLPPDAFTPLLGALSPPHPPPPPPTTVPPPQPSDADPHGAAEATGQRRSHASPPPPLQLDASPQDEAAAAANHYHQEREWSHHQRQEVRELVRSAARAATLRHPRNPQTAGEEHKWSLAPVPEVRVRNPTGPVLTRVSWKVQSLNAKVIVGIE
jgi:hypothetical protein